jgi:hypothetical protein
MEHIKELKADFETAYNSLSEARKAEIETFYDTKIPVIHMLNDCKSEAQSLYDWADRKGYGIGEIGYNINEHANTFGEDVPELQKIYKRLLTAYIDFIDETRSI